MYPLIASIFLLAISMMLPAFFILPGHIEHAKIRNMAANYCVYREAVVSYLNSHAGAVAVPAEDLPVPNGYVALGNWQARIVGNHCYIFGTAASTEAFHHIRRRLGNSVLVGENRNGIVMPSGVSLPAGNGVPNGAIVSFVRVQ